MCAGHWQYNLYWSLVLPALLKRDMPFSDCGGWAYLQHRKKHISGCNVVESVSWAVHIRYRQGRQVGHASMKQRKGGAIGTIMRGPRTGNNSQGPLELGGPVPEGEGGLRWGGTSSYWPLEKLSQTKWGGYKTVGERLGTDRSGWGGTNPQFRKEGDAAPSLSTGLVTGFTQRAAIRQC